jgi:hypothetical protein
MEEEKRIIWLPKVTSWKAFIGVTCYDERMQTLFEALCWDGKVLHHDDEKETLSGVFEKLVEWERDWSENKMNEVG